MTIALLGTLVVLALIDSTSFGTLLIPLWLMAAPGRLRPQRVLVFLATVAVFYWGVGLALLWGADLVFDDIARIVASPAGLVLVLVAGILLIIWSYRLEAQAKKQKTDGSAGPTSRWRARAMGTIDAPDAVAGTGLGTGLVTDGLITGQRSGLLALVALALAAATVELGSMLPYLGAIGALTASDLGWPATAVVLAGYCSLMIAPALALLAVRVVGASRVEPVLARLERWLSRNASTTLSWVVGIVGVLLVIHAVRSGVFSVLHVPIR